MKVTALIDDKLVEDVRKLSGGKNITESIVIAMRYYLNSRRMYDVIEEIEKAPLQFKEDFAAYGIRKVNRNR